MARASRKSKAAPKQSKSRVSAVTGADLARAEGARLVWGVVTHPLTQQLACGLALLLALSLLYRYSGAALRDHDRFRVKLSGLRLQAVPEWVPRQYPVQIRLPRKYADGASIFDPDLVRVVHQAYSECPWVARVRKVEKVYPNQLRISLDLRKPVAVVKAPGGKFVLIDAVGFRLPGVFDDPPQLGLALPIIEGARSSPPPPGRLWRGDMGVVDGARLAKLWSDKGMLRLVDVRRIDVSNVGGRVSRKRSEVVLTLADDTPLYWGRVLRPGRTDALRVPDEQKIANLRRELSAYLEHDPRLSLVSSINVANGVPRIDRRGRLHD